MNHLTLCFCSCDLFIVKMLKTGHAELHEQSRGRWSFVSVFICDCCAFKGRYGIRLFLVCISHPFLSKHYALLLGLS